MISSLIVVTKVPSCLICYVDRYQLLTIFMFSSLFEEVNCTLPDQAPLGAHFVSPHTSYSFNEVVRVACTDGPGSTSWTCNHNGQWNSHYIPCASLSGKK